MIVGNTIRITDKNLKNGYFVKKQNGFHIVNPSLENGINLYCRVYNGKITGAVEVFECSVTREEKILSTYGNYEIVKKFFMI